MPFMEVRKCQVDKQFIMQVCAIFLVHDETAQVANLVFNSYMFHYILSLSLSLSHTHTHTHTHSLSLTH